MTKDCDIAVVGAGPAGVAAACRAAEGGARVVIVDDNPQPGGQIWRASANAISPGAERWIGLAKQRNVELIAGACVVAAPAKGLLVLERFHDSFELGYRKLIITTGARECFLPFPGWTLPNVMGAGGLQALAKSGLPVRDKNVVVAGSGPLLLAVAGYLRTRGARVRLIAEQTESPALVRFGLSLLAQPLKLLQAARLHAGLLGVRYLTGCWPLAAHGGGQLKSVTLRRDGREWQEPCDFLACGFGLVPNTELAALVGCRISEVGVAVDEFQQTSVSGIFCAGEVTGIGGLELSLTEGQVAGYAASGKQIEARRLFAARASQRKFAEALARAFAFRAELKDLAQDETILCRCEDVTIGKVRGCTSWREAKLHTRLGMGPCQGRVCGRAAQFLFGWTPESVRPPAFPARIGTMAK